MWRFVRIAAFGLLCGCTDSSLDLSWADGGDPFIPFPQRPGTTPVVTPVPTPFLPGALPTDKGDGHSGTLNAMVPTTINTCLPVLTASGVTVEVEGVVPANVVAGERVLLWQVQDTFATIGDASAVTAPGGAGLFELARIASVSGTTLTLSTPLGNGYDSSLTRAAQVCTVPEYTDVNVIFSAISGDPWDGKRGGVVAMFVSGDLTLAGPITANGLGFRGGPESANADGTADNTNLTTNSNNGGGKGEGLDPSGVGDNGRGNYANAAGGGNSRNAGGGGGGAAGAGGFGGKQNQNQGNVDGTKGLPGARIATAVLATNCRFAMGGGGGGGHINDGLEADGGAGGGLVLLFAASLLGNSPISADGDAGTGNGAGGTGDGGGGGGGGGMVIVLVGPTLGVGGGYTGIASARGGDGGTLNDNNDTQGPGGGGGGGWVISNVQALVDIADTSPGVGGTNDDLDDNGATDGVAGAEIKL